ncbi:hypothetical protein JQ616_29955 [Bradyrhizobium tropiciagri]|uniref:hypothetical protein n=1 Tax=Bradyrhizobium tropiciagri TaxID=312253 RepID=UPI001BA55358|nr:hypothetical protein [Bradyrhizobium tropiciagri]MBR0899195.1 hypothetical protein [Bradyrhizobium tropiciagri]
MRASIGKAFAVCGAVVLFGLSSQGGCAQEALKDEIPSRFRHSLDLLHKGRCQEAWDELWKFAQTKDYYALYLLTGSVFGHPFKLTGATDVETVVKLYLPMEIYATLTSEIINSPFSIEAIRRSVIPATIARSRDLDRSNSKMVVDCFGSTEPQEACVRLATQGRLIPEYDAYIAMVNSLNKTSLRVECETPLKEFGVPDEQKNR